jgi:hypothetical protein
VIARVVGVVALLALLAVPVALVQYEQVRDAWHAQGAAIDTAAYDAQASDAAYREVERALDWVLRAVRVSAVLLLLAGLAIGRSAPPIGRATGSFPRRIAARALDLGTLALALALTVVPAPSPGVAECLDWLGPSVLLAVVLAAAANGATLGDRVFGLVTRAE